MSEQENRILSLAADVLQMSRNTLLVDLRFLDAALHRLQPAPVPALPLATDGRVLAYDPHFILKLCLSEENAVTHAYLHVVMHGVFRHMFVHTLVDHDLWDLACDIAVESVIAGLGLASVSVARDADRAGALAKLSQAVRPLTAEKLYAYYRDHCPSPQELLTLRGLFSADDHALWYRRGQRPPAAGGAAGQPQPDGSPQPGGGDDTPQPGGGDGAPQQSEGDGTPQQSEGDAPPQQGNGDGAPQGGDAPDSESLEREWEKISRRMQTEIEHFGKRRGISAGGLMQSLRELNRERYDYTAFLKKFAVRGEVMRVNDDEFDYIYYTYGLRLYKKMPLIEPLEYKEVKRIREFVVAIDTSGSVAGEQVQTFLQKTYNVLKNTESFFSKINVHIIQCDAAMQEDAKITSQEDFDRYLKTMQIRGLGGTDFLPVFEHVNELIRKKEFTNLKGLIYVTDGFGTFPAKKPDYETAFVFIDDEANDYRVPPWAIRLILKKDEL